MKNHNRKKVIATDQILQRDQNYQTKQKKFSDSNSSSDFSQFQLNSKNLKKQDDDFSPFSKPNNWGVNKKDAKNSKLRKKDNQNKKQSKIGNRKQKQKKMPFQNLNGQHTISFKKSVSDPEVDKKENNKSNEEEELENGNKMDDESLIQQYDKAQFNNKTLRRKCEQYNKNLQRSRSKQNEKQMKQTGLIKAKGGLCFEIDKTGFPCDYQNKPNRKKREKKNRNKLFEIQNLNQQILKRRQLAFRYGEIVRRRTFGYY